MGGHYNIWCSKDYCNQSIIQNNNFRVAHAIWNKTQTVIAYDRNKQQTNITSISSVSSN